MYKSGHTHRGVWHMMWWATHGYLVCSSSLFCIFQCIVHEFKTLTGITYFMTVTNPKCHSSLVVTADLYSPPRSSFAPLTALSPCSPHITYPIPQGMWQRRSWHGPSVPSRSHQEGRRGQCSTLAADAKNGWRNSKGLVLEAVASTAGTSPLFAMEIVFMVFYLPG